MGSYGVTASSTWIHGKRIGYAQGCRCKACETAEQKYQRRKARRNQTTIGDRSE